MAGSAKKSSGGSGAAVGGLAILGVGTAGATVWFLRPNNFTIILILLAALLVILVLLVIWHVISKWLAGRKAAPFTSSVTQAAGSTPNSISALASRAKLDDLRKNFEAGVTKFTAAGKDLYQLPWYLLIGESGSGKTEAIRHSGIPFPPGLHDQLQGAGGTVNMNWWFTNDAVIVDTAGRYLFEEIQPGQSGEWTEFLRLLSQNRPQCPINGLLLVIPANSLILDTADKIEAKAGKIAQQLDRIQRTLDVRFPVYVVVTKCDLINGFREFFDGLSEQRQQHQILGWSNPAPLDEPFNPELVDQHLKTVHSRLMERRMGLLLDPVARESADAKRIDEVDALYSLPDSFLRIGPRLRQYLEMVFVAGEWSPKPLFLRGIYFTSSMREGQALDAELADLLGVPVDSLSENRMWDRDRAFFLRDLFIKKVFPEKGLVTRAVSAKKVERNRKISLLAAGFAGALALLGFTYFGAQQLKYSVSQQADDWASFGGANFDILSPATPDKAHPGPAFHSRLEDKTDPSTGTKTVGELHTLLFKHQQDEVNVPLVLKPAAGIIGHTVSNANINANKHAVYRQIYAKSVLAPLVNSAAQKIQSESTATWNDGSTAVLSELIHVRALQSPDVSTLFNYVIVDSAADAAFKAKYAPLFEQGMSAVKPSDGAWPQPVQLDDKPLDVGVAQFIKYWDAQIATLTAQYQTLANAAGEPAALQAAQDRLTAVSISYIAKPPKTNVEYQQDVRDWQDASDKYNKAYQALSAKLDALAGAGDAGSLVESYKAAHKAAADKAAVSYDQLLRTLPAGPATAESLLSSSPPTDELSQLRRRLQEARDRLGTAINPNIVAGLAKYDATLLAMAASNEGAPPQRVFVSVHQMFDLAKTALTIQGTPPPTVKIEDVHAALDATGATLPNKADVDKLSRAAVTKSCNAVVDVLATPKINYDRLIAKIDSNGGTVKEQVNVRAAKSLNPIAKKFTIPLTPVDNLSTPVHLNPKLAVAVLRDQYALVKEINEACDKTFPSKDGYTVPYTLEVAALRGSAQALVQGMADYVTEFTRYYKNLLYDASNPSVSPGLSWKDLQAAQQPIRFRDVNDDLRDLGQTVSDGFDLMGKALAEISIGDLSADKIRDPKADADTGIKILTDHGDEYVRKMQAWRNLGIDANDARNIILTMAAQDFVEGYIVSVDERNTFASQYWNKLTMANLHVLASTPNGAAAGALTKLRSPAFQKFPLNLKAPDSLDPASIDQLRDDVNGIAARKAIIVGAANKANLPIQNGGRPNQGTDQGMIKVELDKMVDGGLAPKDWETIENLRRLLDALPRNRQKFNCDILLPSVAAQAKLNVAGQVPAGPQFHKIELQVNGRSIGTVNANAEAGGAFGTINYPTECTNGAMQFAFYDAPAQFNAKRPTGLSVAPMPPNAKMPWPHNDDPWQCVRYISGNAVAAQATPPEEFGTTWDVELTQQINKKPYSLWIRVKFERPFPAKENWPQ